MTLKFGELKGKTFDRVEVDDYNVRFLRDTGPSYGLWHDQDCCESVFIESIDGDIEKHLPGHEILEAYESYSNGTQDERCRDDSCTWSFYIIRTMQDTFTIRFFGMSNGFYSETASLHEI